MWHHIHLVHETFELFETFSSIGFFLWTSWKLSILSTLFMWLDSNRRENKRKMQNRAWTKDDPVDMNGVEKLFTSNDHHQKVSELSSFFFNSIAQFHYITRPTRGLKRKPWRSWFCVGVKTLFAFDATTLNRKVKWKIKANSWDDKLLATTKGRNVTFASR